MPKQRFKLNIEKCIILSDAERVKKGLKPFRDRMALSRVIEKELETEHPYQMLYRAEFTGFCTRNEVLIAALVKILEVTEEQLISEI